MRSGLWRIKNTSQSRRSFVVRLEHSVSNGIIISFALMMIDVILLFSPMIFTFCSELFLGLAVFAKMAYLDYCLYKGFLDIKDF